MHTQTHTHTHAHSNYLQAQAPRVSSKQELPSRGIKGKRERWREQGRLIDKIEGQIERLRER